MDQAVGAGYNNVYSQWRSFQGESSALSQLVFLQAGVWMGTKGLWHPWESQGATVRCDTSYLGTGQHPSLPADWECGLFLG